MTTGARAADPADAPADAGSPEEATGPSIGDLLELVEQLAVRRPVAARVVAMTDDRSVGSKELTGTLTADVALTTRVMKLANSAYFGLGGRVRTVTFAITVVGFSTIRAMAATAAAGLDSDDVLPADFWPRSKATAVACSSLAPLFGVPAPDAFCLGLLSGLGQAILIQHDEGAYQVLLDREDVAAGGRRALLLAEQEAYGFRHTQVSAAALSAWSFPRPFTDALDIVDDPSGSVATTPWSRCLASSVEAAGRLVDPDGPAEDVLGLSEGAVTEDRLAAMLPKLHEAVTASDW